jgi:hypothetical protein
VNASAVAASPGRELPAARAWQALLAAAIAVRTLCGFGLGFKPFDDTFITFRYALNLASGNGFVYNVAERVLGTTSPAWTLILAAAGRAGADLPLFSLAAALAADAAAAILLLRLLRQLGLDVDACFAGALLFTSMFDYLSLARSGMETSLFVLLVIAALEAASRNRTVFAWGAAGLASLTRPEGLILLPVLAIASRWQASSRKQALAGLAVLAALLGGWTLFAGGYFGAVVPQSIIAKQSQLLADPSLARFSWLNLFWFFVKGQHGGGVLRGTYLQMNFVLFALAALAAIGLLAESRQADRMPRLRPVLLLGFPAILLTAQALSHALTWFPWYYGPIYPFLAALAALGLAWLARHFPRPRRGWILGVGLATLILGQLLAALLVKLPNRPDSVAEGYLQAARRIPATEPGAVAAFEIGAVGWATWPRHVIDLLGLVTPAAVATPPLATIRHDLPRFLVVRSDDAARFLAEARNDPWFVSSFASLAALRDPMGGRDFLVFRRRGEDRTAAAGSPRPAAMEPRIDMPAHGAAN